MFDRLQKKWKVNGWQLLLILSTFAIGGSLTGYVSRKLMYFLGIEQDWLWILVYIIIVTLLWPLAVLFISIPFGQYPFFINYLKKIGRRMRIVRSPSATKGLPTTMPESVHSPLTIDHSMQSQGKEHGPWTMDHGLTESKKEQKTNVAVFASGAGSNAARIIDHFRNHPSIRISLIVCNKPGAGVLNIAEKEGIPVLLIEKEQFFRGNAYVDILKEKKIDWIVLAGFLWKVPSALLKAFPAKIINIHPALLPNYGGKGMYGAHVHQAVITNKDKESGITIHYVDDQYDHGATIFQARCPVREDDTAESLAKKIHELEHEHYPLIIERLLSS